VLGFTHSGRTFKFGTPRTPEQLKSDEEEFYANWLESHSPQLVSSLSGPLNETSPRASLHLGEVPQPTTLLDSKELDKNLIVDPNIKRNIKQQKFQGSGGFGRVFKGSLDKKPVAIKKMKHVTDKEKKRNMNEIGHMENMMHNNIVNYHKSYLESNEVWVIMELMEGGTLSEASQIYDFTDAHIAYVAREMLQGIEYIHNKGLAHRDLKSSNVMLTVSGQVKLIDFGFCVAVKDGGLTQMVGSPFWMPPEMIQGRPHGSPVDIWSLGVSLLEMVLKKPPHRNSSVKAMYIVGSIGLTDHIKELEKKKKISINFYNFLLGCLNIDPSQRSTASQLLTHKFLDDAPDQNIMSSIISSVFVAQMLTSGGFV